VFKLACGDVMPGCPARFENADRGQLLAQVAGHAAQEHGILDLTPEVRQAVEAKIAS
jgi:predicted small metal-binding protein